MRKESIAALLFKAGATPKEMKLYDAGGSTERETETVVIPRINIVYLPAARRIEPCATWRLSARDARNRLPFAGPALHPIVVLRALRYPFQFSSFHACAKLLFLLRMRAKFTQASLAPKPCHSLPLREQKPQ